MVTGYGTKRCGSGSYALDRLPTDPERTAGMAKARTHKGDQELLIDLLADTEFIEMAGSADPGFVHTTGQRLLQRDLSTTEALHLHRRAR